MKVLIAILIIILLIGCEPYYIPSAAPYTNYYKPYDLSVRNPYNYEGLRIYGGTGNIPIYDSYNGLTREEWNYRRDPRMRMDRIERRTHRGLKIKPYADDPLGIVGKGYGLK